MVSLVHIPTTTEVQIKISPPVSKIFMCVTACHPHKVKMGSLYRKESRLNILDRCRVSCSLGPFILFPHSLLPFLLTPSTDAIDGVHCRLMTLEFLFPRYKAASFETTKLSPFFFLFFSISHFSTTPTTIMPRTEHDYVALSCVCVGVGPGGTTSMVA